MEIRIGAESVAQYDGDAVVVGVCEKAPLTGAAAEADACLDGLIGRLVESAEIRGKAGEVTVIHTQGKMPASRVVTAGMGEASPSDLFAMRRAMGAAARVLRGRGCRRIASALHLSAGGDKPLQHLVRAVVESTYQGFYRGAECRTEEPPAEEFDELCLLGVGEEQTEIAAAAAKVSRAAGEATNHARRLVNMPANSVTPSRLAEEAIGLADRKGLSAEVLGPKQIGELGMGALLAVARGSEEPAQLVVLRHRGRESGPRVAFIGKGLTFDSGGISLKPAEDMHQMKGDMAGAAAVLAAMGAAADLELPVNLMGVIPAAENLPSGRALKPGDVVKCLNGKTIEIISTDAEGRLILADALTYAIQLGATHLVDVATLTGACIIALGHVASGIMGNDNGLVEAALDAAEVAGERLWRLPLFPEYRAQIDSTLADMKNVGGRPAGAITAGWFLREFAGETSWAHIDIAGTAWSPKDEPHQAEGATGAGTRTLVALAERLAGGMR